GAGHEQRLSLGAGQVQELRDQRSDGAARHDDRALGAEWAARPDGDGRGKRFEQGDFRLDAAAVDENRLDRLGNAVSADALGAEAGEEPDHERAGNRHQDYPAAERVRRRRDWRHAQMMEEEQVGEEADQLQQRGGDEGGDAANCDRKRADGQEPWSSREVREFFGDVARVRGRAYHVAALTMY